jgi:hypothetical protein
MSKHRRWAGGILGEFQSLDVGLTFSDTLAVETKMKNRLGVSQGSQFPSGSTTRFVPNLHGIFYLHLLAFIGTAIVGLILLIAFTHVPKALTVAIYSILGCSLVIFPSLTVISAVGDNKSQPSTKFDYIAVAGGISFAQLVFIIPGMACILTPNLDVRAILAWTTCTLTFLIVIGYIATHVYERSQQNKGG